MNNNALLIFIKNPILGTAKTRLAATIGDEKALDVYLQLLNHTHHITKNLSCQKLLFYNKFIDEKDQWENDIFNKHLQNGNDLGEKMKNGFKTAFEQPETEKVVIIGSDCGDLTSKILNDAFEALNDNDVVIGAAEDGGYYLIGMKKLHSFLFENKEWSTETVLQETLTDCKNHNLSFFHLPTLNDIDTYDDWVRWKKKES